MKPVCEKWLAEKIDTAVLIGLASPTKHMLAYRLTILQYLGSGLGIVMIPALRVSERMFAWDAVRLTRAASKIDTTDYFFARNDENMVRIFYLLGHLKCVRQWNRDPFFAYCTDKRTKVSILIDILRSSVPSEVTIRAAFCFFHLICKSTLQTLSTCMLTPHQLHSAAW